MVSDGLLAAVEVFGAAAATCGESTVATPAGELDVPVCRPAGLSITPDALTMTDRYVGVLTFDMTGHRRASMIPKQASNVASPTPARCGGTLAHGH